jgi:hypothetical protein
LAQVLFVDNALFSFACNLKNGIPVVDYIGQPDDTELVKVSKYLRSVSQQDNLMEANESTFCLQSIIESDITTFIKYYSIDELSEYDETDFEEDGMTAKSESTDLALSFDADLSSSPLRR